MRLRKLLAYSTYSLLVIDVRLTSSDLASQRDANVLRHGADGANERRARSNETSDRAAQKEAAGPSALAKRYDTVKEQGKTTCGDGEHGSAGPSVSSGS